MQKQLLPKIVVVFVALAAGTIISPANARGDIYVANYGGTTIGEYTNTGATVNASLISGLNHPVGLALSGSDLFVSNPGPGNSANGTIGKYTISGTVENATLVSGLGYFPGGLAVSGSHLFEVNEFSGLANTPRQDRR